MKIDVAVYGKLVFQTISITHDGEPELIFDGGGYRTTRMVQMSGRNYEEEIESGLFVEVNEFIETLSAGNQLKLYECYIRAEGVLQSFETITEDSISSSALNLEELLKDIVKDIYDIIQFDALLDYVKSNTSLKIPIELSDEYQTDDKITSAYIDKTYTLSEYMDLMALVLGLRFMIPIWGPYLKLADNLNGKAMKEYHTFDLMRTSSLYHSRAFERMDIYIRANISSTDKTMASVLHFLSSEEIPTYAIAITVVRKLSIAPISADTDKHHLMRILYSYATNKIKSLDRVLEPGLNDKVNRGIFIDDNSSVFCLFKMKEQISTGEKVYIQTYIERFETAAAAIIPDIPAELVVTCVNNSLAIKDWAPCEVQKTLVSWVLSPVVTGSTIPLLNYRTLMIAMGISQAVLLHWGLVELALILTAKKVPKDPGEFKAIVGKKGLSEETLAKLEEIYPYELFLDKRIVGGWSGNVGVRGVELFHEQIALEEWIPQVPKRILNLHPEAKYAGVIEPAPELREQLAQLLFNLHDIIR